MADLEARREKLRKARERARKLTLAGYALLQRQRDDLVDLINGRIKKLTTRIRKQAATQRRIVPRSEWGAPSMNTAPMSHSNDGVFVHHTVAGSPTTEDGEKAEMRNLDRIARSRGFAGISYSYVIFQSGRIYEGRGKGVEGAHTIGYNDTAYGVSAAGNYETAQPSDAMIASYRWLRREYLGLGSKPLRPHSAVYSTACPGKNLRARLGEM